MNVTRQITAAQHAAAVSRGQLSGNPTFAKLGEDQAAAAKRMQAQAMRKPAVRRTFPKFKPGMSTAEYVAQYEASNSGGTMCRGFWGNLNTEPAALYEGGALDWAPELLPEEFTDEAPEAVEAVALPEVAPVAELIPEAPADIEAAAPEAPAMPEETEAEAEAPADAAAWALALAAIQTAKTSAAVIPFPRQPEAGRKPVDTGESTVNHPASRIHVGRVVKFWAGYGGTDGMGAIVAVHGTPNPEPDPNTRGVLRVIRSADCVVDVILFDGRELYGIHQCSIDRPGIGIKLQDDVMADVSHLPDLAAERKAAEAVKAARERAESEAREAARKIEHAPLFYWNGIKDDKGGKLQKCFYSDGPLRGFPEGTITIYARDYRHFSKLVHECFEVHNATDTMTDYFDDDVIRVIPAHPLYAAVKAAHAQGEAHNEKMRDARKARRAA